jgi:hypothetical protein
VLQQAWDGYEDSFFKAMTALLGGWGWVNLIGQALRGEYVWCMI